MSDLVYQNYNNKCQGWVNPSNLSFGPQITFLSGYQSPAGSNTVVAINGINFFSYSTISFGTFSPTVYFINSNLLQFYVPNTLTSGTFPVRVFNGSFGSNTVNYTIDNASGYWLLNSNGSTISNSNTSGVNVTWLSRGPPVYIDNSTNVYNSTNPYTIPNNVNWIICDGGVPENNTYIQLPIGTSYIGRELTIKSLTGGFVVSTMNNIILLTSGPMGVAQNIILPSSSGQTFWATLVNYDGTLWIIMAANWQTP